MDYDTMASKVSEVLKAVTTEADGSLKFPEDTPEELQFAALSEKRRRDAQSQLTPLQQKLKAAEAQLSVLEQEALNPTFTVPKEVEELKFEDPDKWRAEMDKLESVAKKEAQKALSESLSNASTQAIQEYRESALSKFVADTGFNASFQTLQAELPKRMWDGLQPDTDFYSWLSEAKDFIERSKVPAQNTPSNVTDIGQEGGSDVSADKKLTLEELYSSAVL